MARSGVCVLVLLFLIASQLKTVFSSGATRIRSPSGWSSVEGSNITLGCWVSQNDNGMNADTICRNRIRFTRNSTVIDIDNDSRYSRSGATRDGQTNRINCTMTIFRLQSEDSGSYGCCWPAVDGNCSRHPTKVLKVMQATTVAPTTTPMSASSSDQTTGRRTSRESNAVVYTSVSMKSLPTSSGRENEAFNQRPGSSIHKTVWPLLLVIAVLVVIIIFGKRYVKRKSTDGQSIPSRDPECPGHLPQVRDHSIAYDMDDMDDMDGVVATTTTTTTTTVLTRKPEEEHEESER